jgi:hypothetical protein
VHGGFCRSHSGRVNWNTGHRRPPRRELEQVYSEPVYLPHYTGTNWFGQGLFLLVRGTDLLLRTLCSPVW